MNIQNRICLILPAIVLGKYLYLESSAPSKDCDKAWYQSGIIQPGCNAPVCVKFWYHMYGADIGSLNIYMATGSQLPGKLLWTVSGNQGDVWKSGHVPLSYTSNISVSCYHFISLRVRLIHCTLLTILMI